MKKILALTLATVMMMTMVSCGKKEAPAPAPAPAPSTSAPAASSTPEAEDNFLDWKYDTTEILCPLAAGGGTDLIARILAQGLSEATGKNFIVTNNTNGSGAEVYYTLAESKDCSTIAYTLGSYFSTYWTGVHDCVPGEDIVPAYASQTGGHGIAYFCVRADAKWNTFDELLADIKANPGKITFGVPTSGINFFQAYELKNSIGFDCRFVDAAGDSEKVAGLLGGTIDVATLNANQASQYVSAGEVKVLCAMGAIEQDKTPEVLWGTTTFADLGIEMPRCMANTLYTLASGQADSAEVEQLHKLVDHVMKLDSTKEALTKISSFHTLFNMEDMKENFTNSNQVYHDVCAEIGMLAAGRQ